LLEFVLRPDLSILVPRNLGTPPKDRDNLAENDSRNFAFYESTFLRKVDKMWAKNLVSLLFRLQLKPVGGAV
jgi:hypothetical protein